MTNKNKTHLSGSFSDSNSLQAFTKSSGDKSCGAGDKETSVFYSPAKSSVCRASVLIVQHHLHPPGTVDKTVHLRESHHPPTLLRAGSGRKRGKQIKSARDSNGKETLVELIA